MGNYVFSTDTLIEALKIDAGDEGSVHDMGGNIIPMLTGAGEAFVYDGNRCPDRRSAIMPTGAMWEPSTPTGTPTWTW